MGMFDEKVYLTGEGGKFKEGDEFELISAQIVGNVMIKNELRTEAKLTIKPDNEPQMLCYTSGKGIVGAIERMESGDLPARVKLESRQVANGKMFILVKPESKPEN